MSVKIEELYPGKWYLVVHYRGKRVTKKVGTTEAQAIAAKAELEARLLLNGVKAIEDFREDRDNEIEIPTFGTFGRAHLDELQKTSLAFSTWQRYDCSFRIWLEPVIGRTTLDQVTYRTLKEVCLSMAAEVSRDSVRNAMAIARRIMREAMREGWITANPVSGLAEFYGVDSDPHVDGEGEVDPYNQEELDRILEASRDHEPDSYEFVLCAARTGLRFGEERALYWTDFDFAARKIRIRRNWPANRPMRKHTKTGRYRNVDMSSDLRDALTALLKRRKEEYFRKGQPVPEFVFLSAKGRPIDHHNFVERAWRRIHEKTADPKNQVPPVRRRNWHNLRHTYASLLLSRGANLGYVSEQLGHAKKSTTLDLYFDYLPPAEGMEVDLLMRSENQVNTRKQHANVSERRPTKE